MIISSKPYPDITNFFLQRDQYCIDNINFFLLGRDALLSAFMNLGLNKGDSIIIPAYIYESAIKPLEVHGFNLVYVDVDTDLTLSLDRIKKITKDNSIKALLVVHYFGFTKNFNKIIDFCKKSKIKVVEDASHSFMSQFLRNNDDIKCDAEIFSMRKTLPVVDGGALRMRYKDYNQIKVEYPYSSKICDLKYLLTRLLEKIITGLGINIYGQLINQAKSKFSMLLASKTINCIPKPCQPSWQLNSYLNNDEYLKSIEQKVSKNFKQLSQALLRLEFSLLFDSLKKGIVPQACIVNDENGGLVEYLRSKGVGACRWPGDELPKVVINNSDLYSNTISINNNLVLIPIHQSLNSKKINKIIQVLRIWKVKKLKNK